MKIFFIINPIAGNGKALEEWEKNKIKIFKNFGEQNYEFTKYPGHAIEISKKISNEDFDLIVSVGGDGTLNEVVNGLVNSNKTIVILPFGTGSDFGKTIGIRNLDDFLIAIKNGKKIKVDIGNVYFTEQSFSRYFINILEIGFGAEVMNYVNKHKSLGKYSFILGIISTLSKMKKFDLNIQLNTIKKTFSTIEVIVANGKYFGGGMLASPDSKIDDGFLNLHILKSFSKLTSVIRLRNLISGEYIKKGYSYDFISNEIFVENSGILVEMDGDVIGKTPIKITILEKKIEFLIPQKF
ncbi:MAG: diacylglycerol kinase family lipid kinase [Thermoplasmata archaeon]